MTINYINTGSGPNRGDGDSLRVAFTKINSNFSELSSFISTVVDPFTDQALYSTSSVRFANVTPVQSLTYDLGSAGHVWRNLHVGSDLYLGSSVLRSVNGKLTINGSPIISWSTSTQVWPSQIVGGIGTGTVSLGNYNFSGSILQADNPIFRANDATLALAVDTTTWTFDNSGTLTLPSTNTITAALSQQVGDIVYGIEAWNWHNGTGDPYSWNPSINPVFDSLYNIGPSIIGWTFYSINNPMDSVTITSYGDRSLGFSDDLGNGPYAAQSPDYVPFHGNPVVIQTQGPQFQAEWTFGSDGKLTTPGNIEVNGGRVTLHPYGNAYIESVDYGVYTATSALNIFAGPDQKIKLRAGFGLEAFWTFGTDGGLEFPAGYVLPTTIGAPGQVITLGGQGGTSWAPTISIGDSAPALQDLWFNNSEGRLYIKDNGIWVDANPTVIPPPSTYLDDITVEGSTFTINGSSLTIDEAGTLLVNGTQVTGGTVTTGPTDQITSGSYRVSVADTGVVTMVTARGNLEFGALPEPGGPSHFHIMRAPGQDGSGGMDLFFGDDFNYVRQRPAQYGNSPAYGVEIGTNDFIGDQQVWRFGTDGLLTLPSGNTRIGSYNGSDVIIGSTGTGVGVVSQGQGGYVALEWIGNYENLGTTASTQVAAVIVNNPIASSSGTVQIATGLATGPTSDYIWEFGADGTLTIPGDIQDANGSVIRVATTSTAPTRENGQLWFNNQEGRLYIKDNDTWVDANPTVIPPPSTYLDDITVEGSTFTINGSTLTIDSTGTLLVNGGQVSGSGGGVGFEYATIQEGITGHPVTSITGNHTDGLSLTSDRWAQLMWVPDTGVVTLNDIDSGGSRYNWAYVDNMGLNIENKTSSSQSWLFDNNGSIELPRYGQSDGGIARLQSHNGYPTLMAYGSGGQFGLHGGPELDWMDSNNPDQDFYNNTATRHTLYLNDGGLYVGFNENGVAGNPQVYWTFKPNGNILWSNPSTATVSTFNDFAISTDKGASTKTWTFGLDGSTIFSNGVKFDGSEGNTFALDSTTISSIDLRDDQGRGFYTDNSGFVVRGNGTYGWEFGTNGVLTTPGDLLPGINNAYNLGSPTQQWKSLHVSTGTIYIGGVPISVNTTTNTLQIGSVNTTSVVNVATFGLDSTLTVPSIIVGNSGNLDLNYDGAVVLSGIPGVGAVIQTTTSGSSNTSTWSFGPDGTLTLPAATPVIKGGGTGTDVTIIASTGTNPQTWTFAADGNLHLPVGGDIVDSNNVSVLGGGSGTYGDSDVLALLGEFAIGESTYGFNNNATFSLPNTFALSSGGGNADISTNNALTVYANNGVTISTLGNDYSWNFNSDGTTQFPYFKFPASDGAAYQMLQTDGSGNLTWVDNAHNYISNGTSGVTIPGENGNVTISVEGNTIAEFTPTGVNITGNLNITNSATYIVSTNTVYTDSLIEIHAPTDGVGGAWTNNDLNDIGFRFHYYDGADKNAALYMDNGTWRLTWAAEGVETNGQFVHSGLGDIEARAFYGALKGTFTGGNYDGSGLRFDVGTGAVLYSTYDGNVYIQTGQNGTVYNTWQFTYNTTGTGGLVFPDSTVQTTAWTGAFTTATTSTLGGVKIGSGITITGDGTVSLNTGTLMTTAVQTVNAGGYSGNSVYYPAVWQGNNNNPDQLGLVSSFNINASSGLVTAASANITGPLTVKDVRDTVYSIGTQTSGTVTIDPTQGDVQTATLTGNITINGFVNPVSGQTVTLIITQDGVGSRTLTSTMKFAGGYKTLTTSPNAIDMMTISYIGSTYYASLITGFA